jgi:hypothetical protein
MMLTVLVVLGAMAAVVPVAETSSTEPVFSTTARSADGAFRFSLDDTQLSVWRGAQKRRVGHTRFTVTNAEGRFVQGNNILVTGSCGSPCEVGTLFTTTGQALISVMNPLVSSDDRYALELDVQDLTTGDTLVTVVDLKTGRAMGGPTHTPGLFACTARTSTTDAFVFSGCAGGQTIRVPLPTAKR